MKRRTAWKTAEIHVSESESEDRGRHGSFNQAAESLYTTQPNVSKVIGGLEQELGRALLERTSKGIKITPYGETIQEYAGNILKNVGVINSMRDESPKQKFSLSTYIRLIRNNMLENMKQDYVMYANVLGLPQKNILMRHILKNSMHTCIVAIGMSIPQLISGTIVVENVFAWPGLGTLCISSIFNRDYPVIQTYVLLIGVLFVAFNLLFDILQTISDPRMRKGEA